MHRIEITLSILEAKLNSLPASSEQPPQQQQSSGNAQISGGAPQPAAPAPAGAPPPPPPPPGSTASQQYPPTALPAATASTDAHQSGSDVAAANAGAPAPEGWEHVIVSTLCFFLPCSEGVLQPTSSVTKSLRGVYDKNQSAVCVHNVW
jgi:hypothetical protein